MHIWKDSLLVPPILCLASRLGLRDGESVPSYLCTACHPQSLRIVQPLPKELRKINKAPEIDWGVQVVFIVTLSCLMKKITLYPFNNSGHWHRFLQCGKILVDPYLCCLEFKFAHDYIIVGLNPQIYCSQEVCLQYYLRVICILQLSSDFSYLLS